MKAKVVKVNWRRWNQLLKYIKSLGRGQVKMEKTLVMCKGMQCAQSIYEAKDHSYGTVGCIAGWAQVLFSKNLDELHDTDPQAFMTEKLGLDEQQSIFVFAGYWDISRANDKLRKRQVIQYMEKASKEHNILVRI